MKRAFFLFFFVVLLNPIFCDTRHTHLSGPIGPKVLELSIGIQLSKAYELLKERFPDKKIYYNPKARLEGEARVIEVGHPKNGEIHVYSGHPKKLVTLIQIHNPNLVFNNAESMTPEEFAKMVFKELGISGFYSCPIYLGYRSNEGWEITIYKDDKVISISAQQPK